MVKRMLHLVAAVLILALSIGLSGAESLKPRTKPLLRGKPVKLFTGTFVNPAGRVHNIQIVDGGFINIKNEEQQQYYRLWARTGEDGMAEVTVEKYLDAEFTTLVNSERIDTALDGRTKRATVAPFKFTLDGVRHTRAEIRKGRPVQNKMIAGECCIDCGDGWVVCCGVAIYEAGWMACCEIDTSCAWCQVCAWWAE